MIFSMARSRCSPGRRFPLHHPDAAGTGRASPARSPRSRGRPAAARAGDGDARQRRIPGRAGPGQPHHGGRGSRGPALAARAFGALDALGLPQSVRAAGGCQTTVPPDLVTALYSAGCATCLEEAASEMSLIFTLYPR